MKRVGASSERTRRLIINHATIEFATKGYDGARVDSIAERCRCSKNMLYHYFRNKEGLFIAVLEAAYTAFRASQQDIQVRGSDPIEAMQRLVSHTFSAFLDNQQFIALLNSENLHKGRHIRRSRAIRSLYDPLMDTIRAILKRGSEQGVFRKNLDPVYVYLSMSALAYNYISNQYTLNMALGIDFTTRRRRAEWTAFITDLILTYCRGQNT